MGQTSLELVKPEEYFRDRVSHALQNLNVKIDDGIEFYLVNLLCEFIDPQKIAGSVDDIDMLSTPLAIMLKKALEAEPGTQLKIYKRLGDTSLYFAGFFQGYFTRRTIDIDYYISMGSSAYDHVSRIMKDRHGDEHFKSMYQNLSDEFQNLVEIIATIAVENAGNQNALDILAVYNQWTKTPTERLRRILEEQGIQPIPIKTKQAQ